MDRTEERHARTRDESYNQLHAARYQLHTNVTAAALEDTDLAANLDRVVQQLKCQDGMLAPRRAWCVRRS